MRVVVVECRNEKSADYWWRYTLDMLYRDDPSLLAVGSMKRRYPQRMIRFNQFDLYFISTYDFDNFIIGRHFFEYYGMTDTQYESMVDKFIKQKEGI